MAWFSSKIAVSFIDDSTGVSFGEVAMPVSNLPKSFDADTTFHIGGVDWSVVSATSPTRAEYKKSKTLVLRLHRIEQVNPQDILFSLPTLCDALPATSGEPLTGSEFLLTEDDWRQLEFVSHELAAEADAEIAQVQRIHEAATVATTGWREVHVRKKLASPLTGDLSLENIANALGASKENQGVAFHKAPGRLVDGFALTTAPGLTLHGVAPGGKIAILALSQDSGSAVDSQTLTRLKSLAQDTKLDLVDWCRCTRATPGESEFDSLLSLTTGRDSR